MTGPNKALLISETGWRGIKEFSSSLAKGAFYVDIVIKGGVDKEVLEIITRTQGVRIHAIPRNFFIAYIFFYILRNKTAGNLKTVIVTKESTRNWLRAIGVDAKVLVETKTGYDVVGDR